MWRKITKADIKHGTVIRITAMSDTAYNGATIIAVRCNDVRLARPMAYAHELHYDARSPLLYCEVFEMTVERMCKEDTDIEVWESPKGVLTMLT